MKKNQKGQKGGSVEQCRQAESKECLRNTEYTVCYKKIGII